MRDLVKEPFMGDVIAFNTICH